jgi:hypothetical protein
MTPVNDRSQRLRSTLRGVPVAALLLGLLAVVALASRAGNGRTNVPAVPGPPAAFLDWAFTIGLVVSAGAMLLALRRLRLRKPKQLHSNWYVLGTILVVAAAAIISAFVARQLHLVHRPDPGGAASGGGASAQRHLPPDRRVSDRSVHFRWEAGVIGLALLAAAGASVVLLRRRGTGLPGVELEDEQDLTGALSAALDESLDDLRREPDPRRAVIAAYARAEGVLAAHGVPRRPAEAPLEYLARVLVGLRVRASAVLELTELFERAKFSTHRIDHSMKDDAIGALVAVRDDLGAVTP